MMRVAVLLPSTGRAERLGRCLRKLIVTSRPHHLEICVVVDNDMNSCDAVMDAVARGSLPPEDAGRVRLALKHNVDYVGNSAAWNQALSMVSSEASYMVFAADDLIWHEGWLDEALRVMLTTFDERGGLVGFNDGHWDGNELSTHYIMSRWFVENVMGGKVAWEGYKHSFNDVEANGRAKKAGRFAWAPGAVVEHEHWTFGTREQDETDRRFLSGWAASQQLYADREAAGFPDPDEVVRCE